MRFSYSIRLVILLLGGCLITVAQNDSQTAQATAQADQGSAPAPAPAFGQNAPILSPENPPISGIDEPRLDLRRALRSFVSGGLGVSESGDSNPNNQLGNTSGFKSVTHVIGVGDLQRFWPKSDLLAEYVGGGAFYTSGAYDVRQLQAVGLEGVTRWRTGQVTIRDSLNYLPEGSFQAGGFGGGLGLNLAEGGSSGLPGGGIPGEHGGQQFTSFGLVPRLSNLTLADIVQSLSPRSAVTLAGSFSFSHFLEQQDVLYNSQQTTLEGGYSYMVNRRDQVGAVVAFQQFRFPQSPNGTIDTYVLNLRWGRTISGRMSLLASAGPQYTSIYQPSALCVPGSQPPICLVQSSQETHVGLSARVSLRYQFPRAAVSMNYEKFTSSGSGIFAGSDTQLARASFSRPLTRTWELLADMGYAHETRLAFGFKGFPGKTSNSGFIGATLRKHIGRSFDAFAAYHFNETALDTPDTALCGTGFGCGRISSRNVATIGMDWHTRPIRIE